MNTNKIREFLMNELYCPYGKDCQLKVELVENSNGDVESIQIITQTWKVDLEIDHTWFNFSTNDGCGIDEYELEYVMDIKDSWDELIELVKQEEV